MRGASSPRSLSARATAPIKPSTTGSSRALSSAVAPRSITFRPLTNSLAITNGTP